MKVKMKVLCLLKMIINISVCSNILNSIEYDENLKATVVVLHQIMTEYFVKPNIKFDIHAFTPISYS